MQLTTEDKARVFALYLGSDYQVEYVSVTTGKDTVRRGNLSIFDLYMYQPEKWGDVYTVKLILKDLADITDEDAIEVIKSIHSACSPVWIDNIVCYNDYVYYDLKNERLQLALYGAIPYMAVDKLRELGYAVDYKGINLFHTGIAIKQTKL